MATGLIVGGCILAASSAAAAQDPLMCAGLDATVVFSDPQGFVEATEGDDVILITDDGRENEAPSFIQVYAGAGDDIICLESIEPLTLYGEEGNDTIYVTSAEGFPNRHVITAGTGDDVVFGGDGEDWLLGEEGDDELIGGKGNDRIFGGPGNDVLHGNEGFDAIVGDEGNDVIRGGLGSDALQGKRGADTIYGGPGSDLIFGQQGADVLFGGDGDDTMYSTQGQAINELHRTSVTGDAAGAKMSGGAGDDILFGSNRWDRMRGGTGNDIIWGFEGRDWIRGGPGDDRIVGGQGVDDLAGNTGADIIQTFGADLVNGGYGIDRCTRFDWDSGGALVSCERGGLPSVTYMQ